MSGRVPGAGSPDQAGGGDSPRVAQAKAAMQKVNTDVQELRTMGAKLMEMSQSYPVASKALRAASDALSSAARQIPAEPGITEPPVPNTTA